MKARIDIRHCLACAADALEDEDGESPSGYAVVLRHLARHLEQLARDPGGMWSQFAEVYCLEPEDLK